MFNGIEVDMLSLGDADAILLTQWNGSGPHRVLVDGGAGADADVVLKFLDSRGVANLWAVVCTHPHNDHASGLVRIVKDRSIAIHNAWMHDLRKHIDKDALRRATAGSSSQADGVKQVVETTEELAGAFANRGLTPREPFAGALIAGLPSIGVLAPSLPFYRGVLRDFTDVPVHVPVFWSALLGAGSASAFPLQARAALAGSPYAVTPPIYPIFSSVAPPVQPSNPYMGLAALMPSVRGALSNSSVKEEPATQPFNNSSTILGVTLNGARLMLTGDAGSDALAEVPAEWEHLAWMQIPHHGSDGNLSREDIERFCPKFAYVSARGDTSHPSRAIVSGLEKVGATVFSTHKSGNLCFSIGNVPLRADYSPAIPLRGTGELPPMIGWSGLLPRS